jgi:hypothetical protein
MVLAHRFEPIITEHGTKNYELEERIKQQYTQIRFVLNEGTLVRKTHYIDNNFSIFYCCAIFNLTGNETLTKRRDVYIPIQKVNQNTERVHLVTVI